MMVRNKIKRRIDLLIKMLKILIKEPRGHPWGFYSLHLMPQAIERIFQRKIYENYGKSLLLSKKNNYAILDLKLFKLIIKNDPKLYYDVGRFFLEILYPYIVRCPIEIFQDCYEKNEVRLKTGDVVIDAGANLGIFSIFAAQKIGLSGKVYAFEPIFSTREFLMKSVRLNQIKNIRVERFALGDFGGKINFSLDDESSGNASAFFKRGENKETVQQITLDTFIFKNNIQKVNFIKVDIEGMERNLLAGAETTIKKFKPRIAICAYHRVDDPVVLKRMLSNFVPKYKFLETKSKLYVWI